MINIFKGQTVTTIGEEKRFNPRLSKTRDDFVQIMSNLKLDYPKMIGKFDTNINLLEKAFCCYLLYFIHINRNCRSKKYDLWHRLN